MSAELEEQYMYAVTQELRASGWLPSRTHLCGCKPDWICETHRTQRAVDHYHPELIRP